MKNDNKDQKCYSAFVNTGVSEGKNPELVGEGLFRSLFCYWCVRELGESLTAMARLLGITQPAVGYAVERGESLAKKENHHLFE